ncbi:T9SS type A sorting domain-containing protein [Flavobacterium sp. GT3R68]|uniref:T9SS type A sorting domain-containing protein n=1 Tax=Flavobacterium sp. GT3R68 TaxID=2594437 RepID=UPI000F869CEA|nr:T9SS type A sorting domain-containing protein [Flavobacterium sp. GT3R68]RTY86481.1 T9SS type A sorting domain-containing protein [Flavobacterium sp. GSN2]TRW94021.1 T9SS type A sorting domain-containing protein [Flavobacterium sp. GT3R68]
MKKLLLLIIFLFSNSVLFAQANTCVGAFPLCEANGSSFPSTTNSPAAQVGPNYSCLGSQPNPTWFYMQIDASGPLNFQISQTDNGGVARDVDFILYGPFADPVAPCSGQLTINNVVGCSYSASAVETFTMPNGITGQFYLMMVTNFSNQPGTILITQTNVGAPGAGTINCGGVDGLSTLNAFLDSNNNGTKEFGEVNFPLGQFHYEMNNDSVVHNVISPTGFFNIYDTTSNTYDLSYSVDPNYAGFYTSSATYIDVNIATGSQTYNFPVTATQPYNDLSLAIAPIGQPRPGFTYQNKIVYANNGNQVASGTLTFNKDALVAITANTQTGTVSNANGFTYNFTNLLPFEVRTMTVTMQVPTIPTVTLGNYLVNNASIAPLAGEVVSGNNTSNATQMIVGSYDPNDKMESHGEQILHSGFTSNDYLYYTIRFENTGTANAVNLRVNDVLDSKLDETSIKMINGSHAYMLDRVANDLTWTFNNIQLPPVSQNPAGGKGYVMFKIKPKPGYAVGDVIPNTASIYFDFNPAIVTNTFQTRFVTVLGVDEFENGNFVFFPNPVNDIVTISLKNNSDAIANVIVYDLMGKVIMSKKTPDAMAIETIDLSAATNGIYFLEVSTTNSLKVVKKLMVN